MGQFAERKTAERRKFGGVHGSVVPVTILGVVLSFSCSGGRGNSTSDATSAGGVAELGDDGAGGKQGVGGQLAETDGAGGTALEPGGEGTCRLPSEEDFRIEQPAGESEMLFNELLPSHLDQLHQAIGKYASGKVKILKGSVDILEHRSVVVGEEDESITSASAIASLSYEEEIAMNSPAGMVLSIFDPQTRRMLRLAQASSSGSGSASVCGVSGFYSSCGLTAGCSNCVENLATVSDELSMNFTALGTYGDSDQSERRIDVVAELRVVPPAELSMEDVLIVNSTIDSPLQPLREPVIERDTYVFEVEGKVPRSGSVDENGCYEAVVYESEWFVQKDCLLNYGVRNFVLGDAFLSCPSTQG